MSAFGLQHRKSFRGHILNTVFSGINEDFDKRLQYLSKEEAAVHARLKRRSKTWRRITHVPLFYTVVLEVLLAIIITIMTIIIWDFASTHARHSVAAVSDALRSDLLEHVEISTRTVLEGNNASAILLARLMGSSVIKGNLSSFLTLEDQVEPALFLVYATLSDTSQVSYMGKNGLFISYYSDFDETFILFANTSLSRHTSNGGKISETPQVLVENASVNGEEYQWYRQSANASTGMPIGEAISIGAFAFWSTQWFQDALYSEQGFAVWGLGFGESRELLYLFLVSVRNSSSGDPFGVLASGVSMRSLMDSLMDFDLHGGDMFLATKDGHLLAQTGSRFHVGGELDEPILLEATKSSNAVVAGSALYLSSRLKNISRLSNEKFTASDVIIQGTRYVLDSTPFQLAGTTLVCVVILPYKNIWGPMKKQSHIKLVLLVILAGCMFFVSCLFVVLFARAASKEMRLCAALIRQREATKQAEIKSNHKSIVFASMSHDLRTSLAAIIGLIDLCCCDAGEGSELEANLMQMNSCATNLLEILNSVLDISKIEAGKLQLEEKDFDIVQVLEEVVDMFSVVALKKGVEVVLDPCDDSVEKVSWVKGDAGRLKQILSNLLSNGVKFTTEGHVILRAWVKQVNPGNAVVHESHSQKFLICLWNCLSRWFFKDEEVYKQIDDCSGVQTDPNYVEFEFEIDDTGKGIPKDRRKAVFENFVQVDESTSRKYNGTGLGLGIVRSLVRLMSGDIGIIDKDEPGEHGTCFRFNLFFRRSAKGLVVPKNENEVKQLVGIKVLERASVESPLLAVGVHAVLMMHGEAGKRIAKQWMERRGLQVWIVNQWDDFIPTLEKLKHEIFFNSFSSSETFEMVSPEGYLSNSWVDDLHIRGPEGAIKINHGMLQPSTVGHGSTVESLNQTKMNRIGACLLLLIDISMIVGPVEQVAMIVSNLSEGGQMPKYKIAWLASANTSSTDIQNLKRGLVPCDLILHKPFHGSRFLAVWDLVQDLIGTKMPHSSEIKASAVLPQMHMSTEPHQFESFHRPTFSLVDLQNQQPVQLGPMGKDERSRPWNSLALAGMHILLAEDNAVLRRLEHTMLVHLGATVECVDNGAEAVQLVSEVLCKNRDGSKDIGSFKELSQEASEAAKHRTFDIVLMDCEMPIMDGYEATRRIREEEKRYGCRLPVIALTAHAMAQEESKCFQAGMDFHLTKPLAVESLLNVVAKIYQK